MSREVVVVSAARTAIGTYGGSLKDTPPTELAALVVKETLARAGVEGKDVGHVVFGHVVNTEPKDMYLSRVMPNWAATFSAVTPMWMVWKGSCSAPTTMSTILVSPMRAPQRDERLA